MGRTAGGPDVFLLGDGVFLGQGAQFGHLVVLYGPAKVLFRVYAHRLALFQSQVAEEIDLEGATQAFLLLLDEDGQAVASSVGWNHTELDLVRARDQEVYR